MLHGFDGRNNIETAESGEYASGKEAIEHNLHEFDAR